MNRVLLMTVASTALLLSACGKPTNRYQDGTRAPLPSSKISESGHEVETSYPRPNSPTLSRWRNGLIVVSCPEGYHFETINPAPSTNSVCEPNPPPGIL